MNGRLNALVPSKSVTVGTCSRRLLLTLIVTCTVFLLVENGILQNVYTVYAYRAFRFNTTASTHAILAPITNATASRLMKNLQYSQRQDDDIFSTDSTNVTLIGKKLNVSNSLDNNTASVTILDRIQSRNSGAEAKSGTIHANKESIQSYPTEPFEIRHNWGKHKKGALDIFILSAIGIESTTIKGYQREVKLNGWQSAKHKNTAIKCCILRNSNKISEYFNPNRTHQKKQLSLLGSQITCPIRGSLNDVKGVTLQFARKLCTKDKTEYLKPLIPQKPTIKDSFAVCLKILYGKIDEESLVYWIEYYLEMKVDKIFTFTYNISISTQEILSHYYRMGILEWRQFDFPWKGGREVGSKVPVFWEDEQVVIYDSFSRLYSYTYFAIIDLDEYLLPKKHGNFKDMMKTLVSEHPKAAGFAMKSYIFNKNWGISGSNTGPDVEKYIERTHVFTGVIARPKNILLPARIEVDSQFHTHKFTPKQGYESVTVTESLAAINHYRQCYYGMRHACDRRRAITDRDILKVIERIRERTQWFSKLRENG